MPCAKRPAPMREWAIAAFVSRCAGPALMVLTITRVSRPSFSPSSRSRGAAPGFGRRALSWPATSAAAREVRYVVGRILNAERKPRRRRRRPGPAWPLAGAHARDPRGQADLVGPAGLETNRSPLQHLIRHEKILIRSVSPVTRAFLDQGLCPQSVGKMWARLGGPHRRVGGTSGGRHEAFA